MWATSNNCAAGAHDVKQIVVDLVMAHGLARCLSEPQSKSKKTYAAVLSGKLLVNLNLLVRRPLLSGQRPPLHLAHFPGATLARALQVSLHAYWRSSGLKNAGSWPSGWGLEIPPYQLS